MAEQKYREIGVQMNDHANTSAVAHNNSGAKATVSGAISLMDKASWREAAFLWLGTRLLFALLTYFGQVFIVLHSGQQTGWDAIFRPWLGWDGAHYARIAREGYAHRWETAFFPLFPILEHILATNILQNPYAAGVAGIIIANLCALAAFALLRILVEREFGRETAQRTLLYLAVFPTAFFLAASYAESLFLLLSIGAFLCLRRGYWLPAGLLAALATLTRPVGILLIIPFLVEYYAIFKRSREAGQSPPLRTLGSMIGGLALPVLALGGFSLYEKALFGSFAATASAQASGGGRSFALPIVGFARAGVALIQQGLLPTYDQAHILADGAFTLLFIALAVVTWRRLPLSYVLYSWAMALLVISTPAHNWYALLSNMRYMLVVFPIFIVLGQWGANRTIERIIFILSLPTLALFVITFVNRGWVA
jgi:hypothetical protein